MRCVITCVHAAALVGLEEDDASRPLRWLFVSIFSIERLRLLGGGLSRLKSTFFYRLLQKKCRYIRRSRHTANRRDKNISLFQKKNQKVLLPFFFFRLMKQNSGLVDTKKTHHYCTKERERESSFSSTKPPLLPPFKRRRRRRRRWCSKRASRTL